MATCLGSLLRGVVGGTLHGKTAGMCGECLQGMGHTGSDTAQGHMCSVGLPCSVPMVLCQGTDPSGPAFHALLRSKLSGRVQGHRPGWAVHLGPFPSLRSSGYQMLGEHTVPGGSCILFICPVSEDRFPGCNVTA